MTSAIQSIFPSNYSEEEIEPIGSQSTAKPEERLTLKEWFAYISKLIEKDLNSPQTPKQNDKDN